jgi:VanZ family protein
MRWPYLLLIAAYCAGIWWMSSQPDVPSVPSVPNADKGVHAVIFGGLAAVVYTGLHRRGRYRGPGMLVGAPVAFAALYGAVDELHQSFVPTRMASMADLVADVTGAVLVTSAAYWWFHRRRAR